MNKKKNGQQVAAENLDKFLSWKETKSDNDYKNMVFRGKLNKVEMAKQTGIGKSAFTQNPALADALVELEDYLRAVGILPKEVDKTVKAKSDDKTDSAALMRDKNTSKVSVLEAENNKLRNEILELKAKIARYSELEEVISTMGGIL